MKRVLSLLLAGVLLCTLCACRKEPDPKPNKEAPATAEDLATTFISAYYLKDMLTHFPLCIYDARQEWEDRMLKDHKTEEAFCAVVQQQADDKGLSVDIRSFDDYLAAFHQRMLDQMQEAYGEHTVSATVASSVKLDETALAAYLDKVRGGTYSNYVDEAKLKAVTEGYLLVVDLRVDGEISDHYESYKVYAVLCDGQWMVAGHTV